MRLGTGVGDSNCACKYLKLWFVFDAHEHTYFCVCVYVAALAQDVKIALRLAASQSQFGTELCGTLLQGAHISVCE